MALACVAIIPADLCFIVFDATLRDPTSDNLAPFELIFATVMGTATIVGLTYMLRLVIPATEQKLWRRNEAMIAVVCGALIGAAFWTVEKVEPRVHRRAAADTPAVEYPRLTAEEVRTLLTSGTEVGRIVRPSGDWEGDAGSRYRARHDPSARVTHTPDGGNTIAFTWTVRPSGALCRGPKDERKCRFIEQRPDGYAAVGFRSGTVRYQFTVEPAEAN